jgi:fluoroacetyl-CoA thioesterase
VDRRNLHAVALEAGLWADAKLVVTDADTAIALGSGTVPVLGTPRVVALVEEACCHAVDGQLPEGHTSVGMRVQVDHLQPTAVGQQVVAEATLEKIEGRRLTFTVSVSDACGLIAAGRVTRVVVETERFIEKAGAPKPCDVEQS